MRKLLSRGDRVKVGYAAGGSVANLAYGFVNAINETDVTSSRYVWLNEDGEAAMTPGRMMRTRHGATAHKLMGWIDK